MPHQSQILKEADLLKQGIFTGTSAQEGNRVIMPDGEIQVSGAGFRMPRRPPIATEKGYGPPVINEGILRGGKIATSDRPQSVMARFSAGFISASDAMAQLRDFNLRQPRFSGGRSGADLIASGERTQAELNERSLGEFNRWSARGGWGENSTTSKGRTYHPAFLQGLKPSQIAGLSPNAKSVPTNFTKAELKGFNVADLGKLRQKKEELQADFGASEDATALPPAFNVLDNAIKRLEDKQRGTNFSGFLDDEEEGVLGDIPGLTPFEPGRTFPQTQRPSPSVPDVTRPSVPGFAVIDAEARGLPSPRGDIPGQSPPGTPAGGGRVAPSGQVVNEFVGDTGQQGVTQQTPRPEVFDPSEEGIPEGFDPEIVIGETRFRRSSISPTGWQVFDSSSGRWGTLPASHVAGVERSEAREQGSGRTTGTGGGLAGGAQNFDWWPPSAGNPNIFILDPITGNSTGQIDQAATQRHISQVFSAVLAGQFNSEGAHFQQAALQAKQTQEQFGQTPGPGNFTQDEFGEQGFATGPGGRDFFRGGPDEAFRPLPARPSTPPPLTIDQQIDRAILEGTDLGFDRATALANFQARPDRTDLFEAAMSMVPSEAEKLGLFQAAVQFAQSPADQFVISNIARDQLPLETIQQQFPGTGQGNDPVSALGDIMRQKNIGEEDIKIAQGQMEAAIAEGGDPSVVLNSLGFGDSIEQFRELTQPQDQQVRRLGPPPELLQQAFEQLFDRPGDDPRVADAFSELRDATLGDPFADLRGRTPPASTSGTPSLPGSTDSLPTGSPGLGSAGDIGPPATTRGDALGNLQSRVESSMQELQQRFQNGELTAEQFSSMMRDVLSGAFTGSEFESFPNEDQIPSGQQQAVNGILQQMRTGQLKVDQVRGELQALGLTSRQVDSAIVQGNQHSINLTLDGLRDGTFTEAEVRARLGAMGLSSGQVSSALSGGLSTARRGPQHSINLTLESLRNGTFTEERVRSTLGRLGLSPNEIDNAISGGANAGGRGPVRVGAQEVNQRQTGFSGQPPTNLGTPPSFAGVGSAAPGGGVQEVNSRGGLLGPSRGGGTSPDLGGSLGAIDPLTGGGLTNPSGVQEVNPRQTGGARPRGLAEQISFNSMNDVQTPEDVMKLLKQSTINTGQAGRIMEDIDRRSSFGSGNAGLSSQPSNNPNLQLPAALQSLLRGEALGAPKSLLPAAGIRPLSAQAQRNLTPTEFGAFQGLTRSTGISDPELQRELRTSTPLGPTPSIGGGPLQRRGRR